MKHNRFLTPPFVAGTSVPSGGGKAIMVFKKINRQSKPVMLRACAEASEVSSEASHSPELTEGVGIPRSEDFARNDMIRLPKQFLNFHNRLLQTGPIVMVVVLSLVLAACAGQTAVSGTAQGQGSYLLGPGMPTIFTFDENSMSCSVSIGTLGAPGPGPFTDEHFALDQVNFGMIVYSLVVDSFTVAGNQATMTGQARSITTVNDKIIENAVYEFTMAAVDNGSPPADRVSMLLRAPGLMWDEHTFETGVDAGLTNGDIVIRP